MASESVKKILEAESKSEKKNADARLRAEEIVREAEKYASIAVQKKISQAYDEVQKIRDEYAKSAEAYRKTAESECQKKIKSITELAEKNTTRAVDAVIDKYF